MVSDAIEIIEKIQPVTVRVRFTKTGALQFISHLDLCRTMKSALIRAGAPLWYSEGFNPHPKMVFALPLSIGTESVCEFMDVKLNHETDCERFRSALDEQTTSELSVIKCYMPQSKFSEIAWAEYTLAFDRDITAAEGVFDSPCVVMKRSKSGEKETDISALTKKCVITCNKARVLLSAESENYLNPEYTAAAIAEKTGAAEHTIMREGIYKADGETKFR